MEQQEIQNKLDAIIAQSLNHHRYELSNDLTPKDIEGWGSLEQAMIITAIQQEFGIKFKFMELASWHTIGDLIQLIEKKLV